MHKIRRENLIKSEELEEASLEIKKNKYRLYPIIYEKMIEISAIFWRNCVHKICVKKPGYDPVRSNV